MSNDFLLTPSDDYNHNQISSEKAKELLRIVDEKVTVGEFRATADLLDKIGLEAFSVVIGMIVANKEKKEKD